jgi:two-component system, chemotaxis family, chemotaxis protein CheY
MASILIIDDSAVQRTILRKILEKEAHEIAGDSSSGQDAIKMYKEVKPDIVLLDIVLFDANGIAILDELMNYDSNANVIMCSSTALRNVIVDSIQLGAKGFMVKPIKSPVLLKTINKIMKMGKNAQIN